MGLNEADTRAKLIDPALHARGWTENLIGREETAATVHIIGGQPRRQERGRVDYTLRVEVEAGTQPIALALIEAKAEHYPPTHGLQQAQLYAKRLNVPFVYASNGHQYMEHDATSVVTHGPYSLDTFPSPQELRRRYEKWKGFRLDSEEAKPLLRPYAGGDGQRRYYQDAAIRAALEKIAAGGKRVLLTMATGSGKTFVAVNLLQKIAAAGQLRRALFLCDRDELRVQGLAALQREFGSDAAAATTQNPEKNARVLVATYQTLGVDRDEADASFLTRHYPPNYFSHIIIDEAHRSAWGKWSEVLIRNAAAVQIGLTATPREFADTEDTPEARQDSQISANNIKYFGAPVYDYSIGQGIEDGYLAAMEIIRRDIFLNYYKEPEKITGVRQDDLEGRTIQDSLSGATVPEPTLRDRYEAPSIERALMLPERVAEMCRDLFEHLLKTGSPEQKTIIFCATDRHADEVAIQLNNRYREWCQAQCQNPVQDYAFKCTAAAGSEYISEIRGSNSHHFIAVTVDLLTTGVDLPPVANIVFFRYVRSPIAFYQMIGRGTRLHPPTNKLMCRVYDYTDASKLFHEEFKARFAPKKEEGGTDDENSRERVQAIVVHGLDVHIADAGIYIMTSNDAGEAVPVTLEQYKEQLAAKLVMDIPALDTFREIWIDKDRRQEMMNRLPDRGKAPDILRRLTDMDDYDLYDVLADIGYGQAPKTRAGRAEAFTYKNQAWLHTMPARTAETIQAIASQFSKGGTDTLESGTIFRTAEVVRAGGMKALEDYGDPKKIFSETKKRMFAA